MSEKNSACTAQKRRNQAAELVEFATTPDVDTEKYGPVPINSPLFACLTKQEKEGLARIILDGTLSGKEADKQIEEANSFISKLPNMAPAADAKQGHPLKKGQIDL